MKIVNLSEVIGVEIIGIDLANLDDNTIAFLKSLLLEKHVIVFREQQVAPEDLPAVMNNFGDLYFHGQERKYNDSRFIGLIHADETRQYADGRQVHSERSYHKFPPRLSMLMIDKLPSIGGDTVFINVSKAYNDLPLDIKKIADARFASHRYPGDGSGNPPTIWPIVRIKPETGERFLYVNRAFTSHIIGGDPELLETMLNHIDKEEYRTRVKCSKGDITMWDNLGCQHVATYDYYPETRTGYRVLATNMY